MIEGIPPSVKLYIITPVIIIALSIFGITVAYKHLWIISLPIEQRPQSCGMPLKLLFNKLPIKNFNQSNLLQYNTKLTAINNSQPPPVHSFETSERFSYTKFGNITLDNKQK
jgi:hypothetical protein